MDVVPRDGNDLEDLRRRVAKERVAKLRDRYRIVWLALQGLEALQIADKVGCSRRTVQQWVYRYRDEGLDGLHDRPRTGQPQKLPTASEAAFRDRLLGGPMQADRVCTLRGKDIQRILADEFGAPYSLPGVYDLLHRLDFSCLTPRPRHRKNNPAAMAVWLSDAPLLSRISKRRTRTKTSKSGSRTKRGSGNKAR